MRTHVSYVCMPTCVPLMHLLANCGTVEGYMVEIRHDPTRSCIAVASPHFWCIANYSLLHLCYYRLNGQGVILELNRTTDVDSYSTWCELRRIHRATTSGPRPIPSCLLHLRPTSQIAHRRSKTSDLVFGTTNILLHLRHDFVQNLVQTPGSTSVPAIALATPIIISSAKSLFVLLV